jgi:hypothetical protein
VAPLKSTHNRYKSARKVLSTPSFEPRQELLVTRMKESNRRTTKAQTMSKNRATASRTTTVTNWKPVNNCRKTQFGTDPASI